MPLSAAQASGRAGEDSSSASLRAIGRRPYVPPARRTRPRMFARHGHRPASVRAGWRPTKRIGRLKRIDRAAVLVITLGGLAVVVSVLGILLFIGGGSRSAVPPPGPPPGWLSSHREPRSGAAHAAGCAPSAWTNTAGTSYDVEPDGHVVFRRLSDGAPAPELPVPGLGRGNVVVVLAQPARQLPRRRHDDGACRARAGPVHAALRDQGARRPRRRRPGPRRRAASIPHGRPVREVSYVERTAASTSRRSCGDEVALARIDVPARRERRRAHRQRAPAAARHARPARARRRASSAPTAAGLYHWELRRGRRRADGRVAGRPSDRDHGARVRDRRQVRGRRHAAGEVAAGSARRPRRDGDAMVRAHDFEPQGSAGGAPSRSRRASGASPPAAPTARSCCATRRRSARCCGSRAAGRRRGAVIVPPRPTGYARRTARVAERSRSTTRTPRSAGARCSARSGTKGTRSPSTSGSPPARTDDFESKLSLVPLIFGTIKGTLYAMLFRRAAGGAGRALHLAVRAPDHQGEDQADRRDHGGAAERRHRVPRGALPGRASSRGTSSARLPDDGRCSRSSARRGCSSGTACRARCARRLRPGTEICR